MRPPSQQTEEIETPRRPKSCLIKRVRQKQMTGGTLKLGWYSGRLLYESVVSDASAEVLYEERIVVFRASSEEAIPDKLVALAREQEQDYTNVEGNQVRWLFHEILEIQEITGGTIEEGTEVFYRWWYNPDDRDFEVMRRTQQPPWWRRSD